MAVYFIDDLALREFPDVIAAMTTMTKEHPMSSIKRRGFGSMSEAKKKEIAAMGGKAAHKSGHAHTWDSKEAQAAGKIGGAVKGGNKSHPKKRT